MKKQNYINELLQNEKFIYWVNSSDASQNKYWDEWASDSDGKLQAIQEAIFILNSMHFPSVEIELEMQDAILENIHKTIKKQGPAKRIPLRTWISVAASFLILFSAYFFFQSGNQELYDFAADLGEINNLNLQDGTTISLFADSKLWSKENWSSSDKREVWLDGQAYFDVTEASKAEGKPFIVRTKHGDITVLGTEFNIDVKDEYLEVALTEGEVVIDNISDKVQPIKMSAGDFVKITADDIASTGSIESAYDYTSWTDEKIIFTGTTIKELAELIQDKYGVKVIVLNKALLTRSLDGTYSNQSLDGLLHTVQATFDIQITRKNNSVFIDYK